MKSDTRTILQIPCQIQARRNLIKVLIYSPCIWCYCQLCKLRGCITHSPGPRELHDAEGDWAQDLISFSAETGRPDLRPDLIWDLRPGESRSGPSKPTVAAPGPGPRHLLSGLQSPGLEPRACPHSVHCLNQLVHASQHTWRWAVRAPPVVSNIN